MVFSGTTEEGRNLETIINWSWPRGSMNTWESVSWELDSNRKANIQSLARRQGVSQAQKQSGSLGQEAVEEILRGLVHFGDIRT